ncbi:MAG: Ferredoxin-thioredoxin reductase, catalytic subunit [Candidatus Methanocomedens sp.]|jgi:ferredoxin-thioredoxin reductase catalytic subunit|nr:MAG: Ferredoxin-thioredoxin reductase, catalytic subunit [ANME-2 cluster archaeon]KAF5421875.1 MAG: Ferredoxin-thioredoxin reductase, catalytic subunit [ANME-2 cluster archaeon]MRG76289.1 FtrB [ANME-2 cluster archaeon]
MAQSEDLETEIYELAKANASELGYKLNPDYDIVMTAIKGLANNKKKYGEVYCSCREISGDKEKDRKIICPCVYRSRDIDRKGSCKCALYVK